MQVSWESHGSGVLVGRAFLGVCLGLCSTVLAAIDLQVPDKVNGTKSSCMTAEVCPLKRVDTSASVVPTQVFKCGWCTRVVTPSGQKLLVTGDAAQPRGCRAEPGRATVSSQERTVECGTATFPRFAGVGGLWVGCQVGCGAGGVLPAWVRWAGVHLDGDLQGTVQVKRCTSA